MKDRRCVQHRGRYALRHSIWSQHLQSAEGTRTELFWRHQHEIIQSLVPTRRAPHYKTVYNVQCGLLCGYFALPSPPEDICSCEYAAGRT